MVEYDSPVDSIAFGKEDSQLDNLLFVSDNSGKLHMVDILSLESITIATGGSRGEIVETTLDGKVLVSQSNQIDIFNPVLAPEVKATNPAPGSTVALPQGTINVTFDADMFEGSVNDAASVINPANYQLIDADGNIINPLSVKYDKNNRTALLEFNGINPGEYSINIQPSLENNAGLKMENAYNTLFTAISDFSDKVEFSFTNPRSNRQNQTISYDVTITNTAEQDLQLPLMLVLDPAKYFNGEVEGAASQNDNGAFLVDLQDSLENGTLKVGESITNRTITVFNPDAYRVELAPGIYTLPYPNAAPEIISTPNSRAIANTEYNYQIQATDADGAAEFGYLLYDAPQGMSVSEDGLITWNPTQESLVDSKVEIYVFDKRGGYTLQEFTINVTGGNNKPVINNISAITGATVTTQNSPSLLINAKEAQPLQLQIEATDTDDDKLTYWADNLPGGAVFDSKTGIFTWTPGNDSAGTYSNVEFTVTDGKQRITQTATFLIEPTNQLPELKTIPSNFIREGESVRIQLQASDAEGDNLTYGSKLLPGGSKLDPTTGLFEWTPAFFQEGDFEIPFTVSDGENIVTQTAKITVLNANAAPVFDNLGSRYIQEGEQLRFQAFAFDADNPDFVLPQRNANGELTILEGSEPTITYTVTNLPPGATFDAETATFIWTPDFNSANNYNVTFTATDDGNGTGFNATTSITVPITVYNTNRAPEIVDFDIPSVNKGESTEFTIAATDAENDNLRFSLVREREAGFGIPEFINFVDNENGSATLTVAPTNKDISGSYSFTLIVEEIRSDEEAPLYVEKTFNINVAGTNDAPQINYIGNKVAVVGENLKFDVVVKDNNQDDLTFEIVNQQDLPSGITLTQKDKYGKASFEWALATDDDVATDETYPVTIRVTDSGNGNSDEIFSDEQTFDIVVRNSNTAPQLNPIPNLSPEGIIKIKEAETFSLQLEATDADGDTITFLAENLPQNASLNPETGLLTWIPDYTQARIYDDITIIATDGNKQSTQTFSIEVENTNRAPVIIPLPTQVGNENSFLRFNVNAVDYDVEGVIYSVDNLPTGATFDARTGDFIWKPTFEQSGQYKITFEASDASGLVGKRDVNILIADNNRNPELKVSNRGVALGESLSFTLDGFDPDNNAQLTYSADILPEGATLNKETGEFKWTPNPGQVDDYSINFSVSDGISTVTENVLIKVALTAENPTVNLDLTPSFPVTPGGSVIVTALADSFAEITNISATVNGEAVTIDEFGRYYLKPTTPGKLVVEAVATDADGRVGETSTVIKVRNPLDNDAPVVGLAPEINANQINELTDILGEVDDINLDNWKLEIASFGETEFTEIASGDNTVSENILAQIDPNKLNNGFYQLRLTATDISGRTNSTQSVVEINSAAKTSAYTRSETDFTYTFSSPSLTPSLPHSSSLSLTRTYNSLSTENSTFGKGWRLANTDTDIQTNVALTGRENLGVYEPYRVGTRLYLTTPTGERVGFTFTPQKQEISGLAYYTPDWVADSGVNYTLDSVDAKLTRSGNRLYQLNTGYAYNPASGDFTGIEFTLTDADGTQYLIDSEKGITEQVAANGISLVYSDSGIISSTGETVQFVNNEQGFLKQVIAPDGTQLSYSYEDGNLVAARNLSTGKAQRYGYTNEVRSKKEEVRSNDSTTYLTIVSGNLGSGGESITYGTTPQITDIQSDLGGVVQWNGTTINGEDGEGVARYTFGLREGEIQSTATGIVLVGAEVTGDALPSIAGLTPVATNTDGNYALFAIDNPGLNLISLTPSLSPSLTLNIAGDVNNDGAVDGADSELVNTAIALGNYVVDYDFNRDNVVNAADMQILGSNYGFTANRAPIVIADEVLTHTDLETFIELDTIATDAEGDEIYFRLANSSNGNISFTPDGKFARFTPNAGYSGDASFELIADDGFSTAPPVTISINVSDAPLVNLDIVNRSPRLDAGESTELVVIGDFEDQEDVILPASYLQFAAENELVARVTDTGVLSGVSDGVEIVSVRKNGISAVTAVRVGDIPAPSNEAEFNVALAEYQGLDVYPGSVTLVEEIKRQILVGIEGEIDSPDLRDNSTGTRYFVSNSDVLQVTEDGLITAIDEGIANVTVFHGAAEYVLPVQVKVPYLNEAILGTEGGAVQAADGSMVMVAPRALQSDTTISIKQITKDELALPLPMPDVLGFAGAFQLNVGDNTLDIPAQLAIPSPSDLPIGTQVFFMREGELPDASGEFTPTWIIEETGVVDTDGMIRTSSPPLPGPLETGRRAISYFKPGYNPSGFNIFNPSSSVAKEVVAITAASTSLQYLGLRAGLIGLVGVSFAQLNLALIAAYFASLDRSSIDIIGIPRVGLPVVTTAGVQLNPKGIPTFTAVLNPPDTGDADPLAPPVLEQAELRFVDKKPLVYLTGNNFLNDSNDLGSQFKDLIVDFRIGDKTYEGLVVPDKSKELEENRYEVVVEVPETLVLGESNISLTRRQKERIGSGSSDYRIIELETEEQIHLVPHCLEYALTVRKWADTVEVVNVLDPKTVIKNSKDGSKNLLQASIPVGTSDKQDAPGMIATTSDATRAYVTLEKSGRIALIDLMTLRQVDTNSETDEIDPINLPSGASPSAIAIDSSNKYAYIADGKIGSIYVLDINPNSETYNSIIQTIQVSPAPKGLRQITISNDNRKLFATAPNATNSGKGQILVVNIDPKDRPKKPFENKRKWHQQIGKIEGDLGLQDISSTGELDKIIFTNRYNDARGFGILTIDDDDPLKFAASTNYVPLNLGDIYDYFDVNEAVAATVTNDGKYAFVAARNARQFGSGIQSIDDVRAGSNIGIIKDPFTENAKLIAATRPIPMGLAADLVLSADDKFLSVTYPGVGIAANTISNNGIGGIFTFDVEQIINTVENVGNRGLYLLDNLDRGTGTLGFDAQKQRLATFEDLGYVPIDDINPLISTAADFEIVEANWAQGQFTYGVPEGTTHAPIGRGANPRGMATASARNWMQIISPADNGMTNDLTPEFEWSFGSDNDSEDDSDNEDDICFISDIDDKDVNDVNLYISVFPEGEGLLPDDKWFNEDEEGRNSDFQNLTLSRQEALLGRRNIYDYDYNPNRILTASWERNPKTGVGEWSWANGTGFSSGANTSFTLPDELTLTAGQKYYWAVEAWANGQKQIETGQFETSPPPLLDTNNTNSFRSVSVLTHGFNFPSVSGIDPQLNQMARSIASVGRDDDDLVLRYDSDTGYWVPLDVEGLDPTSDDYQTRLHDFITPYLQENAPLALLPDWSQYNQSAIPDSGFSEAAADSIFASLVQLDQWLGGEVGNDAGRIYDEQGKLIRKQGAIFNSPLHFIGFDRGNVVNSEIIQRVGTYFPQAGGRDGSDIRDIQMTILDANDFDQPRFEILGRREFTDFREPKIQIWENVTFADNYYQTVPKLNNRSNTPVGRDIPNLPSTEVGKPATGLILPREGFQSANPDPNAPLLGKPDVSILLGTNKSSQEYSNSRAGFTRETEPSFNLGSTHGRVLNWYAGTVDLGITEFPSSSVTDSPDQIFRRRADNQYEYLFDKQFYQSYQNGLNPVINPWYKPQHKKANYPNNNATANAPWEGIGTGWFYSALGGGLTNNLRPTTNTKKVPLDFDNTYDTRMRGDYAVPTLFNGNFDAVFNVEDYSRRRLSTDIPGWSFHGGESDISQPTSALVDWKDIPSLSQPYVTGWSQRPKEDNPDGVPIFGTYLGQLGIAQDDPDYKNYALRLTPDQEIIHNRFVIPDWGKLRFDLHVPDPNRGNLNVWIKGEESEAEWKKLSIFSSKKGGGVEELVDVDLRPIDDSEHQDKVNQIGRAKYIETIYRDKQKIVIDPLGENNYFEKFGFETFHLDIPKELRGKVASLKFSLEGNTQEIYLDNIFFKSEHLKFGNPTLNDKEARFDGNQANNYLLERPQYSVSYNNEKKIPNWVAWQLNRTDLGPNSRYNGRFRKEYTLPASFGYQPVGTAKSPYSNSFYDFGHMIASSHQSSSIKDNKETFLFANILPQSIDNNRFFSSSSASAWNNLEKFTSNRMVSELGLEIYNFAGGIGNKWSDDEWDGEPESTATSDGLNTRFTNPSKLKDKKVHIPEWTWKIVLALNPGETIEDITTDTPVIAVMTPNRAEPYEFYAPSGETAVIQHPLHPDFPENSITKTEWRQWETWQVPIDRIEQETGLDFFSELPDEIEKILEAKVADFSDFFPQSFLLAEPELSTELPIVVGIDNSSVVQNETTNRSTSEINSANIFSSAYVSPEISLTNFGTEQVGFSHIGSIQLSTGKISLSQIGSPHVGVGKVTLPQTSTGQVSPTQISIAQVSPTQISIAQIGPTKINPTQVSSDTILIGSVKGSKVINTGINSIEFSAAKINPTKISLPSSITLQQLLSSHNLPLEITNTFKDNPLNLTLEITDLPTGQLAEAQVTEFTDQGIPNGGKILIDHNANGLGWFIDTTPFDHSEFSQTITDTALLATADSEAHGKYDLLTTILHELGHLAGFISGYNEFDRHIQTINGKKTFVGDNFTATLTPDGSHLDSEAHPHDLLNNTLKPGMRKLPSLLNLQILNYLRSEGVSEGESEGLLTAPLTSTPLLGINNGTFDTQDNWSTRGAANIIEGQAVLTEESRLNSSFTQNFIIPSEAKYLQFTILESSLTPSLSPSLTPLPAPGDAFEVALLNTNTKTPLAGITNEFSQTDALLNIQHNGDAYFSDKVKLSGAQSSGSTINLNSPRTVTVDIRDIAPNTEATLYFDLLGFGSKQSKVVIDNVRILTDDVIIPVANNNTATTNQAQPVIIDILDNDTDADGTINPSTIQIETAPTSGNITINDDNTITYTPNSNQPGEDSFTYTVQDDEGNTSNTATVNITINNTAPSINEITVEPTISEGIAATFTATATDFEELSYTWDFGDNTPEQNGQNVSHTFADNGTYTATLTVTDSNGASTVETITLTVNNIAPTVEAGEDQTAIENQEITFNGNYTDPGILDTHSIRWEFGDGNVLVSEGVREGESEGVNYLNPTHTYVNPGTYTATLIVTDNDGGINSDTLQVQVNNAAPEITEITGDTNIEEGAIANFAATATSYGDNELTYTWDFGDGSVVRSEGVREGESEGINLLVSHIYKQNGNYTVTLTVANDTGGTTQETLTVNVDNAAPVVEAGDNQITLEGTTVNFNGNFTDPGILDTHTIEWDFGDGTVIRSEGVSEGLSEREELLNPTHTYETPGTYNVTLTITDSDGAATIDTLQVTALEITKLKFEQQLLKLRVYENSQIVENVQGQQNQQIDPLAFERIQIIALNSNELPNVLDDRTSVDNGEGIGITDGDDYNNSSRKKHISGDEILQIKIQPTDKYNSAKTAFITVDRIKSVKDNTTGGQVKIVALSGTTVVGEQTYDIANSKEKLTFANDIVFDRLHLVSGDGDTQFTFRIAEFDAIKTNNIPTYLKFSQNLLTLKVEENGTVVETVQGNQNQPIADVFERIKITAIDSQDTNNPITDRTFHDNGEGIGIVDGEDGNTISRQKRIDGDEILQLEIKPTSNYNSALSAVVKLDQIKSNSNNGGKVKIVALRNGMIVGGKTYTTSSQTKELFFLSNQAFDKLQIQAADSDTKLTFRSAEFETAQTTPKTTASLKLIQDRQQIKVYENNVLIKQARATQNNLANSFETIQITALDSPDSRLITDQLQIDQGEGIGIKDGDDWNSSKKKRIDGDEALIVKIQPNSNYTRANQAIVNLDRIQSNGVDGGVFKVIAMIGDTLVNEELFTIDSGLKTITFNSDTPFDSIRLMAGDSSTRFTFKYLDFQVLVDGE